jgi:Zn finger protein HypA/HybF involved in hydrogenase expression
MSYLCVSCNKEYSIDELVGGCPKCQSQEPKNFVLLGTIGEGMSFHSIVMFMEYQLQNILKGHKPIVIDPKS